MYVWNAGKRSSCLGEFYTRGGDRGEKHAGKYSTNKKEYKI